MLNCLQGLFSIAKLILLLNVCPPFSLLFLTPQHTTRGVSFSNIRLSRYNSSSGYRSFSSRAALVWNFLPSPMKTCKFPGTFSALLRDLLKDESQFVRLQQLLFDNVFNV